MKGRNGVTLLAGLLLIAAFAGLTLSVPLVGGSALDDWGKRALGGDMSSGLDFFSSAMNVLGSSAAFVTVTVLGALAL